MPKIFLEIFIVAYLLIVHIVQRNISIVEPQHMSSNQNEIRALLKLVPLTVVTQFFTDDGTSNGNLKNIRRKYVQNGKVIENSEVQ